MSESKARLTKENEQLRRDKDEAHWRLIRLLSYVYNMMQDHPELDWPDLPDAYSEAIWRCAA